MIISARDQTSLLSFRWWFYFRNYKNIFYFCFSNLLAYFVTAETWIATWHLQSNRGLEDNWSGVSSTSRRSAAVSTGLTFVGTRQADELHLLFCTLRVAARCCFPEPSVSFCQTARRYSYDPVIWKRNTFRIRHIYWSPLDGMALHGACDWLDRWVVAGPRQYSGHRVQSPPRLMVSFCHLAAVGAVTVAFKGLASFFLGSDSPFVSCLEYHFPSFVS